MSHPHPQQEDLLIYSWGQESPGWNLTQKGAQTKEGLHGVGVGGRWRPPMPSPALRQRGEFGLTPAAWLESGLLPWFIIL